MTKNKQHEGTQKKRSSISYFAFLILVVVVLIALKQLDRDKPIPSKPTLPVADLGGIDSMIVSAIRTAEKRVNASPKSAQTWGELGITYWVNELDESGRECLIKAQELQPKDGKWIYFHGLTFLPENIEAATPLIEKAADLLDTETYAPRLRLANILSEDGHIDQANQHYIKTLEHHPDNLMAQLGLGRIAMANGKTTEAIEFFMKCKNHPFTKKAANNALAALYLRANQTDLANAAQNVADSSAEDTPWPDPYIEEASTFKLGLTAWLDSAGKLVRRGQYTSALPIIINIIKIYPNTGQAYIYLAKIRLSEHKYVEAEKALLNALKYEPGSVEARVQLGVALMWQKRFSESIIQLKEAIAQSPDVAEAHYNLGLSLASNNELQAAANAFTDAIRLKPGLPDSYIGLATIFQRADQKQEALLTLEKALKIAPNHPRILAMIEQLQ